MNNNTQDFYEDDSPQRKDQLKRLFFRIVPYIPLIIVALLIGMAGSYISLRYATKVYAAKTRLIVNDDTQEKNSNLLNPFQFDSRDISSETEREIEILRSRDLVANLVGKLQLNVQYSQKGYIKFGLSYKEIPFKLELFQPDSIGETVNGEVKIINGKVLYEGNTYDVDTIINSKWGKIRWHINSQYIHTAVNNKPRYITIEPIAVATNEVISALSIKPISKFSSIVELTYIDEIPERGVNILDSLITMYGRATVDFKSRISANTLAFLNERLRLVAEELSGEEKRLQSFKTDQGIVDLGAEGNLSLNKLKEADAKIGELGVQMDILTQIEKYVNRRNNSNSQIPATLGTTDPVLTALLNQLYQSEFDLEKTKQISGSKNPQIAVYEEAIAKLKPSIITSINNLKLSIDASRKSLQYDNNKVTANLGKLPLKERLLMDISRQQGIKNAIYTFLLQKREEAAITAAAILPNHRVIERPENTGLVSPQSTKTYALGIFIALLISALFIYFREFFNDRLLFRSQIEAKLQVPIIAELAFQPSETGSPLVVGLHNRSLIGEQFRELRTNLNYVIAAINENCKVILITSSIMGEGKSFVAINTAISLSLTGAKVLLLEFDLRKPKISIALGIAREPGLSNYLINMATEKEIIKAHPTIANFSIISSGPIPPNPAELISGSKLTELMDNLKKEFDYIIIDSPPIGAVTDAKILAAVAHVTLYIVRYNYTDSNLLELIADVQRRKILPNLNIVFNGITEKKILGYSYGKGYGYGYGMGYGYGAGYGLEISKGK